MTGLKLPAARLTTLLISLALCTASPAVQARTILTVPDPISNVYSTADMRLNLATTPNIETPCAEEECELNHAFDSKVSQLGERIATAAYEADPELKHRVKSFEFTVAEKKDVGLTSNASGKIIILRGTQQIGLNDQALAFVLAREMGHVISQHHAVNTTTRVLLSVAAGLLFPALNLFGNSAAVAQTTSAASSATATAAMATTAASTATSYLGAKLLMNQLKPDQLKEADQVALRLMGNLGWSHHDIALALENSAEFEPTNAWSREFRYSCTQVRSLETAVDSTLTLTASNPAGSTDHGGQGDIAESHVDAEGLPLPPLQEPEAANTIIDTRLTGNQAMVATALPEKAFQEKSSAPVSETPPPNLTLAPVSVVEPTPDNPEAMSSRMEASRGKVFRTKAKARVAVRLKLSKKLSNGVARSTEKNVSSSRKEPSQNGDKAVGKTAGSQPSMIVAKIPEKPRRQPPPE